MRFAAALMILAFVPEARAVVITKISAPVFESFEGLVGRANVTRHDPSQTYAYSGNLTLDSGMVLVDPNGGDPFDVLILDFTSDAPTASIFDDTISSAADVPRDVACLYGLGNEIMVELPELATHAGALVTAEGATVTVSVYDDTSTLIESTTVDSVNAAGWRTNFVGFAYDERQIAAIRVTGTRPAVDWVGYSTVLPGVSIETTVEPAGAHCTAGGVRVDEYRDTNGNGVTDPGEPVTTTYICNGVAGEDGAVTLIATAEEPAGANCAEGGVEIMSGIDDNGDSTLSASEVDTSTYLCHGANGAQGPPGEQGEEGSAGSTGSGCDSSGPSPLWALGALLLLLRRSSSPRVQRPR